MSKFFDYDPLNGMVEYFDQSDDKAFIRYEQNVQPLLDRQKALANEGIADGGIKKGLFLGFSLPAVVQMEIMKKGISVHPRNKKEWKRLFQEVESNYPYLKATHKKLA